MWRTCTWSWGWGASRRVTSVLWRSCHSSLATAAYACRCMPTAKKGRNISNHLIYLVNSMLFLPPHPHSLYFFYLTWSSLRIHATASSMMWQERSLLAKTFHMPLFVYHSYVSEKSASHRSRYVGRYHICYCLGNTPALV